MIIDRCRHERRPCTGAIARERPVPFRRAVGPCRPVGLSRPKFRVSAFTVVGPRSAQRHLRPYTGSVDRMRGLTTGARPSGANGAGRHVDVPGPGPGGDRTALHDGQHQGRVSRHDRTISAACGIPTWTRIQRRASTRTRVTTIPTGLTPPRAIPMFVVRVGKSGAVASDFAYSNDNGVTQDPLRGRRARVHERREAAVGGRRRGRQVVSIASRGREPRALALRLRRPARRMRSDSAWLQPGKRIPRST